MKQRVNLPRRGKKPAPRPARATSIKAELAALKERELKLKRELAEEATRAGKVMATVMGRVKASLIFILTQWSGR